MHSTAVTRCGCGCTWPALALTCRPRQPSRTLRKTLGARPSRPLVRAQAAASPSGDEPEPEFNWDAWRRRPAAVTLPRYANTPGRWFLLAGFLKIAMLVPGIGTSPYAQNFYLLGHLLPAGPATMLATVPVAAALALLARYLISNRLLDNKWVMRGVVLAGVAVVLALRVYVAGPVYRQMHPGYLAKRARTIRLQRAANAQSGTPNSKMHLPSAEEAEHAWVAQGLADPSSPATAPSAFAPLDRRL